MNSRVDKAILSRSAVLQKSYGAGGFADPLGVTITDQTLPGGDLRIPLAALSAPLNYTIPQPSAPQDPDDLIEFKIREKGTIPWFDIEPMLTLGPVVDRVWPLPKTIPMNPWMVEKNTPESPTEYEIQYIYWYGATNAGYSVIVTYSIDRTAPYRVKQPPSNLSPKAATFPVDLPPTAVIDEAYIGNNPSGIPLTAADYGNYHATDVLLVWVGGAPDPVRDQPVLEIPLPTSREFTIPIDVFVDADEGVNTVIYRVRDLVGHLSKVSNPASREVKRIADPTTFDPPVVPLASDDLIDLADCHLGVKLEVTVPTPNAPTHTLMGYWGTEELGEKPVSSAVDGKLVWDVPYSIIKKVYGNTDGDEETEFSYSMFRGSSRIGGNNDETFVNIHTVGPDNPDEPNPVNPDLEQPVLTFSGGSTDEVAETDFGKDATISITLFAIPRTEEGWFVKIFYNGLQVGATIPLVQGQENTTLTETLLWDTIFAQGPGLKPLYWVLGTALNPNPTQCLPKDIPVAAFPIQTPAPVVQDPAGPQHRIGCSTLNFVPPGDSTNRRNLKVIIPKSGYTVPGETITLSYAAYTDATPPVLMPGTETTADLPVPDPYPDAGAEIFIGEYADHFKPANRTNGVLTYTITRSGTTPTPPSAEAKHFILLSNSEAQYCEEVYPLP
jgi:hypothetical protein